MMRGLVLALAIAVSPAAAQTSSTAEVSLRHQLRLAPDDHTTMVNLAGLYARTGRPAKAQRLYKGLLSLENVTLERANGTPIGSHELAEQAMRASPPRPAVTLSSR